MEKSNIDWNYSPKLFSPKLNSDNKPDILAQNISSAVIWHHTLFGELSNNTNIFNARDLKQIGVNSIEEFNQKQKQLQNQQKFLQRYIHSIYNLGPEMGSQKADVYRKDNEHTIAELLSGGGRMGLEFDSVKDLELYLDHLFQIDNSLNKMNLIKTKNSKNDISSKFGISNRKSSHDQVYNSKKQKWNEIQSPMKHCFKMNIPIGGVGNTITRKESKSLTSDSVIGFDGKAYANNKKYQLGTMIMKIDQNTQGKARLMVGIESVAPYHKNQFGGDHGLVSSVYKVLKNFLTGTGTRIESRTLTGQSKGRLHGIFVGDGLGTNKIRNISSQKISNMIEDSKNFINNSENFKDILVGKAKDSVKSEQIILKMNLDGYFFLEGNKNPIKKTKELKKLFSKSFFSNRDAKLIIQDMKGCELSTCNNYKDFIKEIKSLLKRHLKADLNELLEINSGKPADSQNKEHPQKKANSEYTNNKIEKRKELEVSDTKIRNSNNKSVLLKTKKVADDREVNILQNRKKAEGLLNKTEKSENLKKGLTL